MMLATSYPVQHEMTTRRASLVAGGNGGVRHTHAEIGAYLFWRVSSGAIIDFIAADHKPPTATDAARASSGGGSHCRCTDQF